MQAYHSARSIDEFINPAFHTGRRVKHNKMSEIKLEVGKTYRSREGEEVKIVKKGHVGRWPCQGSNGKWYTESGRWNRHSKGEPDDLVEEVPETRKTTTTNG